jgi:phosphatidylinositol glycan class K
VRSDLFKRPLADVRITDFLGGVSQVEVGAGTPAVAAGADDTAWAEEPAAPAETPHIAAESRWRGTENTTTETGPAAAKSHQWRGLRAWGGLLLLGALVGWVGWRK